MDEDVHSYRLYVFKWFCRLIGFLLREEVVFCVLSFWLCLWHSLYMSCVLWCAVYLLLVYKIVLFAYLKKFGLG